MAALTPSTKVTLTSIITCPQCNHKKEETMPIHACQFFYKCENCNALLKPKEGDCCVYCSYGNIACPPIQETEGKEGVSCCS